MKEKKPNKESLAFEQGYFCALATIVKSHGYNTETREAIQCISEPISGHNIDPYDFKILKECGAIDDANRHRMMNRAITPA